MKNYLVFLLVFFIISCSDKSLHTSLADLNTIIPSAASNAINTAQELVDFANKVNNGKSYSGETVTLGSDIELGGIDFPGIGTETSPFKGTFDGNKKKLNNLFMGGSSAGLFTYVGEGATVKDFIAGGFLLLGESTNVGIIANSTGTPSNKITITGVGTAVSRFTTTGLFSIGGIVGNAAYTDISQVYNLGDIADASSGGGIVGTMNKGTTLNYAYNTGSITTSTTNGFVGGLVGKAFVDSVFNTGDAVNISNVYNSGSISATGTAGTAGGVTGQLAENTTLSNANNVGLVTGTTEGAFHGEGTGLLVTNDLLPVSNSSSVDTTADVNSDHLGGDTIWISNGDPNRPTLKYFDGFSK